MFRVRLVRKIQENRVEFRVGGLFRLLSSAAALGLLGAGWALGTWTVPLVLAALSVLGALYDEAAVFDRSTGRAEFRLGLLVWHRIRRVSLADIAEVRVTTFGPAKFTGFEVGLRDGRVVTIENDRGRTSSDRLAVWGRDLADWLGVPLGT